MAGGTTDNARTGPQESFHNLARRELFKGQREKAWASESDIRHLGFPSTAELLLTFASNLAAALNYPYALDDTSAQARTRLTKYVDDKSSKDQLRRAVAQVMAALRSEAIMGMVLDHLGDPNDPSLSGYEPQHKAAAVTHIRSGGVLRNQAAAQQTVPQAAAYLVARAKAFLSRAFDHRENTPPVHFQEIEAAQRAAADALEAYCWAVLPAGRSTKPATQDRPDQPSKDLAVWSRKRLLTQLTNPNLLSADQRDNAHRLLDVMVLYPFGLTDPTIRRHMVTAEYLMASQLPYTIVKKAQKKLGEATDGLSWERIARALGDTISEEKRTQLKRQSAEKRYPEISPKPAALEIIRLAPKLTDEALPGLLGLDKAPRSAIDLLINALPLEEIIVHSNDAPTSSIGVYNGAGETLLVLLNHYAAKLTSRSNFNLDHFEQNAGREAKNAVLLAFLKKLIRAVGRKHGFPPPPRTQPSSFYEHRSVSTLNSLLKGIIEGTRKEDTGEGRTSNDVVNVFTKYANDLDAGQLLLDAEPTVVADDPTPGNQHIDALDSIPTVQTTDTSFFKRRQDILFSSLLTHPAVATAISKLQRHTDDPSVDYFEFSQPYIQNLPDWEALDIRNTARETNQLIIWAEQRAIAWDGSEQLFDFYNADRSTLGAQPLSSGLQSMVFDLVLQVLVVEAETSPDLISAIAQHLTSTNDEVGA